MNIFAYFLEDLAYADCPVYRYDPATACFFMDHDPSFVYTLEYVFDNPDFLIVAMPSAIAPVFHHFDYVGFLK